MTGRLHFHKVKPEIRDSLVKFSQAQDSVSKLKRHQNCRLGGRSLTTFQLPNFAAKHSTCLTKKRSKLQLLHHLWRPGRLEPLPRDCSQSFPLSQPLDQPWEKGTWSPLRKASYPPRVKYLTPPPKNGWFSFIPSSSETTPGANTSKVVKSSPISSLPSFPDCWVGIGHPCRI